MDKACCLSCPLGDVDVQGMSMHPLLSVQIPQPPVAPPDLPGHQEGM